MGIFRDADFENRDIYYSFNPNRKDRYTYEEVQGGPWKFGRYELFLAALGDARYRRLPWLVTEYSYSSGHGTMDCTRLWADAREADLRFGPEVWGLCCIRWVVAPSGAICRRA
jgi:hypothetical protein